MDREGILFGMGNPLLDITAEVDQAFLDKYGLKSNDAILAEDKHKNMYEEMVQKFKVDYVAGGATQNVIRVAQWMIGIPKATTFMGCIGKDKFGDILKEKTKEAGVKTSYMVHETEPTGTCAVLVTGKDRSLCAYLAAANCFKEDFIHKEENQALLEKAQFYYLSSFPLTVCPEAVLHIAQYAAERNRLFCLNLSAPFLCEFFKDPMMKVLPYVDILFGNESEAEVFSKVHNFGTTDLKEIAMKMSAMPKQNGSKARMVILTHGAEPTVVVKDGVIKEYPVIHIKAEDIVDTNGAGDAFCGGYMAEMVQGRGTDECIRGGNYAANFVIQRLGCTLPSVQMREEHSVAF